MALRTEPWLPREQVTIRVEKPGVHFVSYLDGYVLEQSDTELVLLETDSDVNRTRLTESAQVTQRIYCDAPKSYHVPKLEDWLEEPPLSHWVAEDSDYEDCPD